MRSRSATAAKYSGGAEWHETRPSSSLRILDSRVQTNRPGILAAGGPLLYLLRVSVPDRPGALGVLASAIGAAGGDITAVDVVEREASSAIDDILIETADAASAAGILSTVSALAGVVIETWQPYTEGDQLHDGLDIVDGLGSTSVTGRSPRSPASRPLFSVLVGLSSSTMCPVASPSPTRAPALRGDDGRRCRGCRLLRHEASRLIRSWLPHEWGADPQLAAAPIGDSPMTLLAVRPSGPRFRRAEIARLANLAAVAALAATLEWCRSHSSDGGRPTAGSGTPYRPRS